MNTILIASSVLLWIIVVFNLLMTFALVRRVNTISQPEVVRPEMLKSGTKAPEFLAHTLDGHEVTQLDYINKERVMVFVAPGCTPCTEQMPKLQELYPKAQKAGVELVVISLEDIRATHKYVEEIDYRAPILSAPRIENPLNENYQVPGTPSYYVIDRDGTITTGGYFDHTWENLAIQWH